MFYLVGFCFFFVLLFLARVDHLSGSAHLFDFDMFFDLTDQRVIELKALSVIYLVFCLVYEKLLSIADLCNLLLALKCFELFYILFSSCLKI